MKYLLMKDGSVMREADLSVIPPSEENPDWLAYLADKSKTVEPFDYAAEEARQADAAAVDKANAVKARLVAIDMRSIRSIREYIAAKPDAPQVLKEREASAVAERVNL